MAKAKRTEFKTHPTGRYRGAFTGVKDGEGTSRNNGQKYPKWAWQFASTEAKTINGGKVVWKDVRPDEYTAQITTGQGYGGTTAQLTMLVRGMATPELADIWGELSLDTDDFLGLSFEYDISHKPEGDTTYANIENIAPTDETLIELTGKFKPAKS